METVEKSILLCGVGGQGTVLASRVIARAAMDRGLPARTAETIGMAQRGGCVVSHVRFGGTVQSALIPLGGADLLIAFEPGEAVRCLPYLKADGVIVVSPRAVQPVTGALGGKREDGEGMVSYLKTKAPRVIAVDVDAVCAACASGKVVNTALLGAAAGSGALGFTVEEIEAVLRDRFSEKVFAMNKKALRLGASYAE